VSARNLVVIPARGGSQGILRKNLRTVHGIPLVTRTLIHALSLQEILDINICVSSDDNSILETCRDYLKSRSEENLKTSKRHNSIFLHRRRKDLSTAKSAISELLPALITDLNLVPEATRYWILMQPTSPFRSFNDLKAVAEFVTDGVKESIVSVEKVEDQHPARMYNERGGKLIPFMEGVQYQRRQDLPALFIRDGAFYVFKDAVAHEGLVFTRTPHFFQRNAPWTLNIDTAQQLQFAESINLEFVKDDPNYLGTKNQSSTQLP
jgi:CMP-N-acetylneuraminic acid synthetase